MGIYSGFHKERMKEINGEPPILEGTAVAKLCKPQGPVTLSCTFASLVAENMAKGGYKSEQNLTSHGPTLLTLSVGLCMTRVTENYFASASPHMP